MQIQNKLQPGDLKKALSDMWELSGKKNRLIRNEYDAAKGSPVYTREGKYTTRGWTEWTQGFQFGGEIIQFDATGEKEFLDKGGNQPSGLWHPI
jgi:unsaturated chondroitin disaccharide hydrolase